jgi:hypothetical protein
MADKKIIVNCETGVITELELTAEEVAQREADAAVYAATKAAEDQAAANKALEKAELLTKLGITADEAALLLS